MYVGERRKIDWVPSRFFLSFVCTPPTIAPPSGILDLLHKRPQMRDVSKRRVLSKAHSHCENA